MTKLNEVEKNIDLNSKDLQDIYKEIKISNHHAYLIETDSREKVFSFLKNELQQTGNQNLFLSLQVFDLEKAKEITDFGNLIFNELHFIVVSFYSINREAQNALLKFLEEAPKNLKIILISHSGAKILNTIYSRLYRLDYFENNTSTSSVNNKNQNIYSGLAKKFLKNNKLSRIKMPEIVELLEKKDEYAQNFEDKERADREAVEIFLLALHEEIFLLFKKEQIKNTDKERLNELEESLKEINEFLRYVKNNSSSGKTILEYLSLKLIEI